MSYVSLLGPLVVPRVKRILAEFLETVDIKTLSSFLDRNGPNCFLDWSHPEKPRRLVDLVDSFEQERLNDIAELRAWITIGEDDRLLEVRGVGPKTVDYLKLLVATVACPSTAIFRDSYNPSTSTQRPINKRCRSTSRVICLESNAARLTSPSVVFDEPNRPSIVSSCHDL